MSEPTWYSAPETIRRDPDLTVRHHSEQRGHSDSLAASTVRIQIGVATHSAHLHLMSRRSSVVRGRIRLRWCSGSADQATKRSASVQAWAEEVTELTVIKLLIDDQLTEQEDLGAGPGLLIKLGGDALTESAAQKDLRSTWIDRDLVIEKPGACSGDETDNVVDRPGRGEATTDRSTSCLVSRSAS